MFAFIRKWFWFGCGAVGIGAIIVALLGSGWLGFRLFQLEWTPQGPADLRMREVAIPFENRTDISAHTGSLPFMAGVVIDIDGDFATRCFSAADAAKLTGYFATMTPRARSLTSAPNTISRNQTTTPRWAAAPLT